MKALLVAAAMILIHAANSYAQSSRFEKLTEELMKPQIETAAETNVIPAEPRPSVLMPIPNVDLLLPKPPPDYCVEADAILITEKNKLKYDVSMTVTAKYVSPNDPDVESISYQILIPEKGATTNLYAASLFLASTNRSFPNAPHFVKAMGAQVDVPLPTNVSTFHDDEMVPMLTFSIPKQLAEVVYLRLDCTYFEHSGGSLTTLGVQRGKTFAIRLKDYIPEKPKKEEHNHENSEDGKDVIIDISI